MKNILLLLSILVIKNILIAENVPYFSTTSTETYTELNNPISVNNGELWNEDSTYLISFDFDFTVFNQTYNSINIDAGGGIAFPGANPKYFLIYNLPFGGYLLKDRGVESSLSDISYEVVGEEGQYIIKIQWENAGFVQSYSTSDISDFVDFQIWIFQEDAHFELHFGDNHAGPGTYGYPDVTSDPDPGPSIRFNYDDCSNILSYYSAADNPSYDYFDMCSPNFSFIDGTPSNGTIYIITPNDNYVGISENDMKSFKVFPNPANDIIYIENNNELLDIESVYIVDMFGKVILEFYGNETTNSILTLNIETISEGIYFIRILSKGNLVTKTFIKNSI